MLLVCCAANHRLMCTLSLCCMFCVCCLMRVLSAAAPHCNRGAVEQHMGTFTSKQAECVDAEGEVLSVDESSTLVRVEFDSTLGTEVVEFPLDALIPGAVQTRPAECPPSNLRVRSSNRCVCVQLVPLFIETPTHAATDNDHTALCACIPAYVTGTTTRRHSGPAAAQQQTWKKKTSVTTKAAALSLRRRSLLEPLELVVVLMATRSCLLCCWDTSVWARVVAARWRQRQVGLASLRRCGRSRRAATRAAAVAAAVTARRLVCARFDLRHSKRATTRSYGTTTSSWARRAGAAGGSSSG